MNIYLNGTDTEAKKKFIEDQVHPEVQPIFELASSSITEEDNKFPNPKVIESKEIENEGEKATITLIQGDGDKEFIALILEEKYGWGFISTSTSEEVKTAFEEMRSEFK